MNHTIDSLGGGWCMGSSRRWLGWKRDDSKYLDFFFFSSSWNGSLDDNMGPQQTVPDYRVTVLHRPGNAWSPMRRWSGKGGVLKAVLFDENMHVKTEDQFKMGLWCLLNERMVTGTNRLIELIDVDTAFRLGSARNTGTIWCRTNRLFCSLWG